MSDSLNIEKMIREKKIIVPDYQRAYSWETSQDGKENKHTNVFVCDLEDYIKSRATLLTILDISFLKTKVKCMPLLMDNND